jgi:hypothetical protein
LSGAPSAGRATKSATLITIEYFILKLKICCEMENGKWKMERGNEY